MIEHPTIKNLRDWGCDFVCWANVSLRRPDPVSGLPIDLLPSQDIYSYDLEQSRGLEGNNILTVLMATNSSNLQEAADRAGVLFGDLMNRFIAERKKLPSWGPDLDRDVSRYVDAIGGWVVGNLCWSFESRRYFGSSNEDVKRTRIVKLRPRETEVKPDENVLSGKPTGNSSRSSFSVRSVQAWVLYLVIGTLFLMYFYRGSRFELL